MKTNSELLAIIGQRIRDLHTELSFEKISKLREYLGLSARTINRLSTNTIAEIRYEPKEGDILDILGLQPYNLAPVCKKCGEVHVTKRCTSQTPKARPIPWEHLEQQALYELISYQESAYPELQYLFAIPNGGKRNLTVAKKLKAEGVKAGVLDNFLPVARGRFHGMWLEMKYGDNTLSDKQKIWKAFLEEQGYFVAVEYSAQNAFDALIGYLSLPIAVTMPFSSDLIYALKSMGLEVKA